MRREGQDHHYNNWQISQLQEEHERFREAQVEEAVIDVTIQRCLQERQRCQEMAQVRRTMLGARIRGLCNAVTAVEAGLIARGGHTSG